MKKLNFINFNSDSFQNFVLKEWDIVFIEKLPLVSFVFIKDDSVINRIKLRRIINSEVKNIVIVSEDTNLSYLAWKANVMGFLNINNGYQKPLKLLQERLKLYPPVEYKAQEKLKINYKGGFDLVKFADICFCVGSGSYTEIILKNSKKKCLSYPINKLEDRLKKNFFLNRIGKSFIINYNNVKRVKKNKVVFNAEVNIELELSDIYIKRLKQNILWY